MTRRLPLDGIRVLAFTHVAAGPYGTLQLAYLGAEVIKVESRTRIDPWRFRDRNHDPERSQPFADHNKNTRSVTLNLKTDEGRRLALDLAAQCDVVIDNYSAGVLERLGLGYAALSAVNPGVIAVHLSGLGSSGPRSHFVTFGPSMMALSGMTDLWNHPGSEMPVGSQTSYPDYLVGVYASYAVLAALLERDETGRGREVDLSQLEVVAASLGPAVVAAANGLEPARAVGNQSATAAPHGCYPCHGGNDAWCVISIVTDEQWGRLRDLIGDPAWAHEPAYATAAGRVAARPEIDAHLADWTRERSPREVFERCQERGIPAGIVSTGVDLREDPHLAERGFVMEMEHPRMGPLRVPGPPIRFASGPLPVWRLGPLMGEDNEAVLGGILGLSAEEIERLSEAGVVQ